MIAWTLCSRSMLLWSNLLNCNSLVKCSYNFCVTSVSWIQYSSISGVKPPSQSLNSPLRKPNLLPHASRLCPPSRLGLSRRLNTSVSHTWLGIIEVFQVSLSTGASKQIPLCMIIKSQLSKYFCNPLASFHDFTSPVLMSLVTTNQILSCLLFVSMSRTIFILSTTPFVSYSFQDSLLL